MTTTFSQDLGLDIPDHAEKPRRRGRTMVIDTGLPLNLVQGSLEAFGRFVDVVKISTLHFAQDRDLVREKVGLYRSFDIDCEAGGPVLELATLQGRQRQAVERLATYYGFNTLEVSATTLDEESDKQNREAMALAREFGMKVFGEVGKKYFRDGEDTSRRTEHTLNVEETIRQFKSYLSLGAEYIYWEGHVLRKVAGNTAKELLDKHDAAWPDISAVVSAVGIEHIFFEVSSMIPATNRAAQQFWWIHQFGPDVNIANTPLLEVPVLEHIRRGTWPVFGFPDARGGHPWYRKALEKHAMAR